jgi:hypothetical protein
MSLDSQALNLNQIQTRRFAGNDHIDFSTSRWTRQKMKKKTKVTFNSKSRINQNSGQLKPRSFFLVNSITQLKPTSDAFEGAYVSHCGISLSQSENIFIHTKLDTLVTFETIGQNNGHSSKLLKTCLNYSRMTRSPRRPRPRAAPGAISARRRPHVRGLARGQ